MMKSLLFKGMFLLTFLYSVNVCSQTKEYGSGILLFMTFDAESIAPMENSKEKFADLVKLIKTDNSYEIYYKNNKGRSKMILRKLEGLGVEYYEYVDILTGHKYVVKDLLDSPVKALDAINTKDLPNVSNRYKMMFRILIQ